MSILLPLPTSPSRLSEWLLPLPAGGARHYASHRVVVLILTFAPTMAEALTLTPSPCEIAKRARSGSFPSFLPLDMWPRIENRYFENSSGCRCRAVRVDTVGI